MFNVTVSRAAIEALDKIDGKTANLPTISDAELELLRINQAQSIGLVGQAFYVAAKCDAPICNAKIAEALELDADRLTKRATRAVEKLAAFKLPSLAQFAALVVAGHAEMVTLDHELERREAARSGRMQ